MASARRPATIVRCATLAGERYLDRSLIERATVSALGGLTMAFAIVVFATVSGAFEPTFGEAARIPGALGFSVAFAFLGLGYIELFGANLLEPMATLQRTDTGLLFGAARLWTIALLFNLAGGISIALLFVVSGSLPPETVQGLQTIAEGISQRGAAARFSSAVVAGLLLSLLSYLRHAVDSNVSGFTVAFAIGFLIAIGLFDHVVVTELYLVFELFLGSTVQPGTLVLTGAIVTVGNLLGSLGLSLLILVPHARDSARDSS